MGLHSIFERTGLSDAELAVRMCVSAETARLWRKGARRMSPSHVKRMEAEFGIARHELRPDLWEAPAQASAA